MLGISQAKLGKALGVSFQQIQKYENGFNRVSASSLARIASFLQVTEQFFFEGQPGQEIATRTEIYLQLW
jgi:transcriptional regulator with XRE-family HTH domain